MPTSDPEGDVPTLELLMGNRPWTFASENGSWESCGICGASFFRRVRAICAGCLITGNFEHRLKNSRRAAEAAERRARKAAARFVPKAPRGSPAALATMTVKERRGVVAACKRTPEGRAWLVSQGLMPI